MVAANEVIAEFLYDRGVPAIQRIVRRRHVKPLGGKRWTLRRSGFVAPLFETNVAPFAEDAFARGVDLGPHASLRAPQTMDVVPRQIHVHHLCDLNAPLRDGSARYLGFDIDLTILCIDRVDAPPKGRAFALPRLVLGFHGF